MGNAPSHSSEDEAAAAGGEGWGPHQDWATDPGMAPGPGPAAPALPPAPALLEPARLREAAAALRPSPPCESLVSRHHGALLRWLEERLGRGEESVTLEQFRELLEARGAGCSGEQFEEVRAACRGRRGGGWGGRRSPAGARGGGRWRRRGRVEPAASGNGGRGCRDLRRVLSAGAHQRRLQIALPLRRNVESLG